MKATDLIKDLRRQLEGVKAAGHAGVTVQALEGYLAAAEPVAVATERELADPAAVAEADRRFEAWKAQASMQHAGFMELFKSALEAGQTALRFLLAINGGGAVALLAFLGNVVSRDPSKTLKVSYSLSGSGHPLDRGPGGGGVRGRVRRDGGGAAAQEGQQLCRGEKPGIHGPLVELPDARVLNQFTMWSAARRSRFGSEDTPITCDASRASSAATWVTPAPLLSIPSSPGAYERYSSRGWPPPPSAGTTAMGSQSLRRWFSSSSACRSSIGAGPGQFEVTCQPRMACALPSEYSARTMRRRV